MGTQKTNSRTDDRQRTSSSSVKEKTRGPDTDLQPNICRHSRTDGLGGRTIPRSQPTT